MAPAGPGPARPAVAPAAGISAPPPGTWDAEERRAKREQAELFEWLNRVRGWEPDWLNQFMELTDVRVEVSRTETRGADTTFTVQAWERSGDRYASRVIRNNEPVREWQIRSGTKFARVGTGPWTSSRIGPMQRWEVVPGRESSLMSGIWVMEPRSKRTEPGGAVCVTWSRKGGRGTVNWIIEPGTWLLQRMESRSALGYLEWVEEREQIIEGGRALMTWRRRRTFEPVAAVEEERIRWTVGQGGEFLTRSEF